jgi:hypothetical protein
VITSNIEPILIITGALTATAFAQFVAPSWVTGWVFGEVPSGPVSLVIARHWGIAVVLRWDAAGLRSVSSGCACTCHGACVC